ncbi:kinesin-like protein KIN-12D [Tanacetum coccineum]
MNDQLVELKNTVKIKQTTILELEECLRKKDFENEHLKSKVVDFITFQNLQVQVEEHKSVNESLNLSVEQLTKAREIEECGIALYRMVPAQCGDGFPVLIRVRPLNGMEITSQGYNRCLKQESAQSLTWVGHPETRFTFDHVACETIDQETLFKMVGLPMVENCLSGYNSCMFAYGQTGSGKTHTMLGEINDLEVKPSQYRGMTPRIFEFLFARIIAEEESRKDERLVYTCKCSFLEIYNEQIADLLDPSSTNLQLREDAKKGVYVENLTEFEVHTVGDILKLLSQGSANRRVAATNMNRESSRSHSVFTCVIESRWEKDSTSNLRFARLNLVDLAGSERQKSSGAEGERLKEAANINKSLSTLGLCSGTETKEGLWKELQFSLVDNFKLNVACSFMLCDLDFEPLSLSLSSLPSCDLVSFTNILILCLILKASNQSLRKSLSLNLELS